MRYRQVSRECLLELYNDFSSGAIGKGAPIAKSARICASAGKSKTDLTKCDHTAGTGDIVSNSKI